MAGEFDGLAAIVTGGASGIGLATATLLSQRGAKVAPLDLNIDGLPEPLLGYKTDVSDDATGRASVAAAAQAIGGTDIVVNNAGIGAQGTVETNPDAEWHKVLDLNVVGMVRTARAALPY